MNYYELKLPSNGRVYEKSVLKIRPFNGGDEEILASATEATMNDKIIEVLNRTIENGDVKNMTLGDRIYVIIWHAINSFEDGFTKDLVCEGCLQKTTIDYKLQDLEVKELPETYVEPYKLKLSCGEVGIRLFRVNDELSAIRFSKGGANDYLYTLALSLDIPSCKDIGEKLEYLRDMSTKDLGKIKAFHEKYYHGPVFKTKYACGLCGYEGETSVPFRPEYIIKTGAELVKHYGDQI